MKTEDYFTYLVKAYSYYHPLAKSRRKAVIFDALESIEKRAEGLAKDSENAHLLLLRVRHLKNVAKKV